MKNVHFSQENAADVFYNWILFNVPHILLFLINCGM